MAKHHTDQPKVILFICAVFPPEPEPSGAMAHELAQAWLAEGYAVTVLTPTPSRPSGTLYEGYRPFWWAREIVDGIRVIRCPHWLLGHRRRPIDRLLENLTFGLSCFLAGLTIRKPSLIILETWPLAATQLGVLLGKLLRVPIGLYVKDVYPEALESAGLVSGGGRLARLLRRWDRALCLAATRVIAISPQMGDLLARTRRLPAGHCAIIPDWVDGGAFRSCTGETWRQQEGIANNVFVALHAGNMGIVSGADMLVDVAQELRARHDILIVCVGEGPLKAGAMKRAAALGLTNLCFKPFQPRAVVPEMHAAAGTLLLTISADGASASVPSKMITYLAAGRPIVCSAPPHAEVARTIASAEAGVLTPARDAAAMARAIAAIADSPEERRRRGENARKCFESRYTLARAVNDFDDLFARLLGVQPLPDESPEPANSGADHSRL